MVSSRILSLVLFGIAAGLTILSPPLFFFAIRRNMSPFNIAPTICDINTIYPIFGDLNMTPAIVPSMNIGPDVEANEDMTFASLSSIEPAA